MTQTRRTVEISDALWEALDLMSREMNADRNSLVNQALFTFARFNGYLIPGRVATQHPEPASGPVETVLPPVAQPLASPPTAVRRELEAAVGAAAPAPVAEPPLDAPAQRQSSVSTGIAPALREEEATSEPNPLPEISAPVFQPTAPRGVPRVEPAAEPHTEAVAQEGPEPEPPDDEELDDGLEALPENGTVEWVVPPHILADARIKKVKGTVKGRDFFGTLQAVDALGGRVRIFNLGNAIDDAVVESVLANEFRDSKQWKQTAEQLTKEQHIGEATLALVRAVGAGEPVSTLAAWLTEHSLARKDRAARERAEKASFVLSNMNRFGAPPSRKAAFLVEELLQGGHPASLIRELAIDQDQFASSKAASDLIRAAKAINPDEKALYAYTQALIELSLGNPDAARVCADELRERSEEQADFLTTYLLGLFPTWNYWPAADPIATLKLEREPKPPVRSLADFRNAIQKTALRVRALRGHLLQAAPEDATWVPPAVDSLLSRGKPTLTEAEQLNIEPWQERNIPQLMRLARNEWARLCWLCWLAGLDAIGLPSATSRPRSPTIAARGHALRSQLFAIKAEDGTLEEHLAPADRADAEIVAKLGWCDTTPADVDAANASELGLPEALAVLQAFGWSARPEVESPFGSPPDEEGDDEDDEDGDDGEGEGEQEEAADNVEVDESSEADASPEATAATGDQEQNHAAAPPLASREETTGEQRGRRKSQAEQEPAEEPASDERTAIVTGRKIWVQREGHEVVPLEGVRFTVGRDPRCEIVIPSPRVSREHASVRVDAETVLVTDLNSSNGTFFNGQRVTKHVVSDGDVVQFGNERVLFRLVEP